MARIAIFQGHPDPAGNRLCHALADAYAEGARSGGHELRRIEIARLDFPLLRSQADFDTGTLPDGLSEARDVLVWADHLVILFPLWQGSMPALLKAFLEQLLRPGIAFNDSKNGLPALPLKGKSARIVVTMGMPAFIYRCYFFAHGLRVLRRNILRFLGIKPVRESIFGMVENASEEKRKSWLQTLRAHGRNCR